MKISSVNTARRETQFRFVLFAGVFVFYAFVMWCTPYSSDDLEFAYLGFSTIGEYIRFALYYGNGRFLGNLCAIAMANSKLLCILLKAFVLASAVVLAPVVLGLKDRCSALLSFLLITGMAPPVLGEAVIWTSGFGNYVPPIWLSLLIILMIRHHQSATSPVKLLIWLAVPMLGTASQLFIEHSSGVNGLLAFSFLVYYLHRKEKAKAALCGLWLLSTAVGLGLMFLIPKIFYRAGNRVETYRYSHVQSISTIIVACVKNAVHLLNYYFGVCEIPLCFGAAATVLETRHKRTDKANRILLGLVTAAAVYAGFGMILSADRYLGKAAVIQHILAGASVLLPFGVWLLAAAKLDGEARTRQLFLLLFAFISMAPLLVVTPTPPRVILQSYVFVILAALECFDRTGLRCRKQTQPLLLTACLCICVLLGSVFFSIRDMVAARDAHIAREVASGATEIEVFILPYQYTTWDHLWSFGYPYENGGQLLFDDVDFHTWMNSYYS